MLIESWTFSPSLRFLRQTASVTGAQSRNIGQHTIRTWGGYEFQASGGEEGYGSTRYGVYEPEFLDKEAPINATRTTLAAIAPAVDAAFVYAYDFGDNWRHDIAVTDIGKPDKRRHYPLCVAGERAGSPEDCGGMGGYRDLLATLEKGRGEGFDDVLRWLGGDPDGFDRNLVNRQLRALG